MDRPKKFNGTVTKFIENFGFIDEEVFFRTEVVEGGPIKQHDQVYVECEYSEHLPFKLNATKVVVLNSMQNRSQPASTYAQHRMQMLQQPNMQQQNMQQQNMQQPTMQQPNIQQSLQTANLGNLNNLGNLAAAVQTLPNLTSLAPEIRKLIESQKQQQTQPQIQNYQQQQQPQSQNNQQFNARQIDYNESPAPFTGQITYTSTPGSAFVSPVLPFNQPMNVQQQPNLHPMPNLRAFQTNNNQNNAYSKRDNHRKDRDREMRDRNRKDDRDQRHNRDDKRDSRNDRDKDSRDRKPAVNRESRDNSTRDNDRRDRRNTESPSNSVASSSNNSKPRRRYSPLNIPIHEILKSPLNTYDIKRNFDSSIHVPSDFKELQINNSFEFDFKNLYKPIQYRIVHPSNDTKEDGEKKESDKKDGDKKESDKKIGDKKETDKKDADKKEIEKKDVDKKDNGKKEEPIVTKKDEKTGDKLNEKISDKTSNKSNEKISEKHVEDTKSDEKVDLSSIKIKKKSSTSISSSLTNKYAVKVILLSFPSMNNIYDRVIENDREKDNYTSNSKAYFLHFNKIFSYLCLKNHNDGHSLVGGKFDPKLDGYIDDQTPNLIQTAIRCVKQQTGIDLSSCKKWKHMCTFLYNRDDSPFYDNVAFEYSNIFIPDVWSLLENPPACIKNENKIDLNHSTSDKNDELNSLDNSKVDFTNGGDSFSSLQVNPSNSIATDLSSINDSKISGDQSSFATDLGDNVQESMNNESSVSELTKDDSLVDISQLNELKVTELRARLEAFGHKVAKSVKKADLIIKLTEIIKSNNDVRSTEDVSKLETKLDESVSKENEVMETDTTEQTKEEVDSATEKTEIDNKRKVEDDDQLIKRVKVENETLTQESKEIVETKQLEKISEDGFIMAYGSSSNTLAVLNLFQALNHSKYDHFELQIASELLKEALIQHFCNYILSACYENRHLMKEDDKKQDEVPKETSDNNYLLLAFSYFDSCHCGYLLADDLLKLLSCCRVNYSKRTWTSIFGTNERVRYRHFKEPTKIYNFAIESGKSIKNTTSKSTDEKTKNPLYVKDGNIFDIEKLIVQSEADEKLKVELKDKLKMAEVQIKNLQANLNELEVKQKKMSSAYKKQNDEICDYKRDKEKIKHKYEESLKLINSTLSNFNDFVKKHEDKPRDKDRDKDNKEKESKDSKEIKESKESQALSEIK